MTKAIFTPAIDCTNQQRPAIALQPVESSQIKAIGYDAATKTLAITFTRGPGNVYLYENVSADTYLAFLSADSLGSYFGQHIQVLPSKKYAPDQAPAADAAPAASTTDQAATEEPTTPSAAELEAAGQERLIA